MILLIFITSILSLITGLFLYARWNYGVLESLGFKVVEPLHIFLGNTADFHVQISQLEDIARFKKYGPVYGVYEGREPQVHVCDSVLIRQIMVNDYEYFKERRPVDFGSELLNEMPAFLPYEKWKVLRGMLSPTFTTAKMKVLSTSMQASLEGFGDKLKREISQSKSAILEKRDIRQEIFTTLTDMFARCAFGIEIKDKESADNHFVKILRNLVGTGGTEHFAPSFLVSLTFSFPFLKRFAPVYNPEASDDFVKTLRQVLKARKESGSSKKDFVATMLEWMDKLDTEEFKNNDITELTVLAQALIFLFAGQDQVSTIVAYTVLSACKDQDIENKIYKEMEEFLKKHDGNLNYDNMYELTYLNACIQEALRLVPFFHRPERQCTMDWEKDGISIKKGMTVMFPLWAAGRNPEYFPDPDKFDPERHIPDNHDKLHPSAISSFGHGPKNCVGMRFGADSLIFTAATLYKDFRFQIRPDTQFKFYPGTQFNILHTPIYLDISLKN